MTPALLARNISLEVIKTLHSLYGNSTLQVGPRVNMIGLSTTLPCSGQQSCLPVQYSFMQCSIRDRQGVVADSRCR